MTDCAPRQRVFKFYTYNHEGNDCLVFFFENTAKLAWQSFRLAYPDAMVDFMYEIVDGREVATEIID